MADIAATVTSLTDRGVAFMEFEDLEQDERGFATYEDGTRVAWFEDPDGNKLSVTQHAATA